MIGIPEIKFCVTANSGRLPVGTDAEGVAGAQAPQLDGVYVCADGWGAYTLFGEYRKYSQVGTTFYSGIYPIGTAAHELGHAIGFTDVYDYDKKVSAWPQPYMFSLQGNGNYGCIIPDGLEQGVAGLTPGYPITGEVPTHIDPWQKINVGLATETTVVDGTYHVGSVLSGKYNILRVNTPDPREYYLIENRQPEGFDAGLYYYNNVTINGVTKSVKVNYKRGGIVVWHIDEDIIDGYFGIKRINGSGTYQPDASAGTTRHDPGIVALFKNAYDSSTGLLKPSDTSTGYTLGYPTDPFYYASNGTPGVFNSNEFTAPVSLNRSLNSFPDGVSKDYNLKIEVLSEPGQDMQVRITGAVAYAPRVTTESTSNVTDTTAVFSGTVVSDNGQPVTERGFVYGSAANPTLQSGTKVPMGTGTGAFGKTVTGLTENAAYHVRAYAINASGITYGQDVAFSTPLLHHTVTVEYIFSPGGAKIIPTYQSGPILLGSSYDVSEQTNRELMFFKRVSVSGSAVGVISGDVKITVYYEQIPLTSSAEPSVPATVPPAPAGSSLVSQREIPKAVVISDPQVPPGELPSAIESPKTGGDSVALALAGLLLAAGSGIAVALRKKH